MLATRRLLQGILLLVAILVQNAFVGVGGVGGDGSGGDGDTASSG